MPTEIALLYKSVQWNCALSLVADSSSSDCETFRLWKAGCEPIFEYLRKISEKIEIKQKILVSSGVDPCP
jgi:hypothetical protein